MNRDFRELLKTFNEHAVKYLIVCGYAVMKYSEPRFTKDLDIWIEASPENGKNVFQALKTFGSPLEGLTANDFAQDGFYQMGRPPVRVDILMSVSGIEFKNAWTNRVETDFDGVPAYFIGLADLIENKKASGRLQDLADIEKVSLSRDSKNKF